MLGLPAALWGAEREAEEGERESQEVSQSLPTLQDEGSCSVPGRGRGQELLFPQPRCISGVTVTPSVCSSLPQLLTGRQSNPAPTFLQKNNHNK